MKLKFKNLFVLFLFISLSSLQAQQKNKESQVMSDAYWKLWNSKVQARINKDIDKYRKAEAVLKIEGLPAGIKVKIEQVTHDFIFGANIFNFNQLGSFELNSKYKELFGTLFNSATIPFYWKKFEMQPNRPRFREEYWDTEAYWNQVENPNAEPHWRRPAPDPIVAFCESKGIRMHGHPIVWGIRTWQHPEWIYEQFCPEEEKERFPYTDEDFNSWNLADNEEYMKMTSSQIASLVPIFVEELDRLFTKRITEIIQYYGGRLHSWDVVNESSKDFHGESVTGEPVCKSIYGLMPGDYAYKTFKLADQLFPQNVALNINDYMNDENYVNQVKNLISHGCRIDIIGSQMHLFYPQQCLDIADGKEIKTPKQVWNDMATISKAGLPIHLSEITITSPGDDERGREIQAIITRNLYRLWFSIEQMMGITWWNIVDGCGAPGEPTISGLFTRNMEPKPSFYALDKLINDEWKTVVTIKSGKDGTVKFRGFKGRYVVTWQDKSDNEHKVEFYLKNDGDGFEQIN